MQIEAQAATLASAAGVSNQKGLLRLHILFRLSTLLDWECTEAADIDWMRGRLRMVCGILGIAPTAAAPQGNAVALACEGPSPGVTEGSSVAAASAPDMRQVDAACVALLRELCNRHNFEDLERVLMSHEAQ